MFQRRDPSKLQQQLEQMTSNGSFNQNDGSEWSLTVDKNGNGTARIRFLPARDDNSAPFVKIYNHGFKHNGRWYIENCPTTIQGNECPVCKANGELWNSGIESDKEVARGRKRKLSYWSNVLVISDPGNPDNNGKVFKYRFGQKIMDKIQAMIAVDVDMGETPVDVTCVFDGADFVLKSKKVSGFANYDESKFLAKTEIAGIDTQAVQTKLMEGMHDLNKIIAPAEFKSTEDLTKKFLQVTGGTTTAKAGAAMDDFDKQLEQFNQQSAPAAKAPVSDTPPFSMDTNVSVDDDLDALLADLG